jgi:hypothetical protein
MAVDLDDGSINHGVFHVRFIRTGLEKPNENIGFDPIAVAFENGVPALPKKAGRSRHGLPVRTIQSKASMKRRLSPPLRPGSLGLPRQCGSIFAHWASVSTNRSIQSLNHNPSSGGILNLNKP